ncbi:5-formyltetrahydrofolate cyclo-ligase [Whalleya microplaca]|nr:5-formyltetrahydrofolate cyclo-ligase [Whalleya microplaca]
MALVSRNTSHKSDIRAKVWKELRKVAYPDSRFHYDFSSFIADFEGSQAAADKLLSLHSYQNCSTVFITPDNCLEYLREKTLCAGIKVLMTTYGIRRGFWLLDPATIDEALYKYASTLDGMEKVGKYVSLADVVALDLHVGFMVTGTGAINHDGIRFGKGHGFFDLEWGMLFSLKVVHQDTMTAALVHDCQVLDEPLAPEEFDTVCDLVITPTRILKADSSKKPTCGILWGCLGDGMLEDIPPLQELRRLQGRREAP